MIIINIQALLQMAQAQLDAESTNPLTREETAKDDLPDWSYIYIEAIEEDTPELVEVIIDQEHQEGLAIDKEEIVMANGGAPGSSSQDQVTRTVPIDSAQQTHGAAAQDD